MDSSLLATKLRIPFQTGREVRRARLVDTLERAIPDYKLIVLSAPAGYGKTTLLGQWARASRFPVAWLTLDEGDNDPERFLRYLLAAWRHVLPGISESPLGLLLGAMSPDREAVLATFINAASDLPADLVFVLDDYHLLDDPSIYQALIFLLDHLPRRLHVVLAGRAEPPLPLARYRARQELFEVGAEELSFVLEETADFLHQMTGLDLAEDEIAPLQARLEGWIAGVQLVSLTLQRRRGATEDHVVSGRHRFIADYLSDDVLAPLPDHLRRFLVETSILGRLSGPLCEAVTGCTNGQDTLETLERANLFLVPLDDTRTWFRYHRLFADVLREELNRRFPETVADLHRRAARWHLAQELPEPAFDHAVAAGDPDLVIQIFERYGNLKLQSGELKLVARWLDALPAAWYVTHPLLGLFRAGLLAFTGAFDDCLRGIDDVEQRLASTVTDDARWQLAIVSSVRCFIDCIQNNQSGAEMHAERALRDLRDESVAFRAGIFHALGDTYRSNGHWEDAKRCYLNVLTFTDWPGHRIQSAHVFGALADLDLRQGRLRSAARSWHKALAAIQDQATWGRLPLPVIGWVFIRLGELLYEWNELGEAGTRIARGLEHAELGGDVRTLIAGYVAAARLKLTEGNVEAAGEYLERARPLVEQAAFPDWTSRFERCQLDLWLAQGRLRAAVDWSDAMLQGGVLTARPESESAQLALARLLIVKGDAAARERATTLLARLRQAAEAEGRRGIQIEALALLALARWQDGDRAGAMTALEQALRLAEPEGYVRLFADLGLPMARLLQEARSRHLMPDYIATLLTACGDRAAWPTGEGALPEPLSARELEILRLIAAGLTNQEIAESLVISPETVKKHTGNIYGKLGVSNRTRAAARARALDLLSS